VDLTAEFGFRNDNPIDSHQELLQEIERYSGAPVILFGNKNDLLANKFWEKAKDIYLQELYDRGAIVAKVEGHGKKHKAALEPSVFANFPHEVTANILMILVSVLLGSKTTTRDRTKEYLKMAETNKMRLIIGSALRGDGVNEVFDCALKLFLERKKKLDEESSSSQ
jgi:hypothetical protein